jgi:hypothetical protein
VALDPHPRRIGCRTNDQCTGGIASQTRSGLSSPRLATRGGTSVAYGWHNQARLSMPRYFQTSLVGKCFNGTVRQWTLYGVHFVAGRLCAGLRLLCHGANGPRATIDERRNLRTSRAILDVAPATTTAKAKDRNGPNLIVVGQAHRECSCCSSCSRWWYR